MTPIRVYEVPAQPWKNGGGTTRELVAWPRREEWQVRVSVADIVSDGLFSAYPGVRRWFAVLEGAGIDLQVGNATHRLTRNAAPFLFDGAQPVRCRLIAGPTRDLNLMLRGTDGRLEIAGNGIAWQPQARLAGLLTAVSGEYASGSTRIEVEPNSLLWFDPAPESLTFTAGARPAGVIGWWIAATPDGS